ncbi:hypothetical protein I6M44_18020 [Shewanella algae]|uniref:hypothetical protein n=1 Tax=Shewanella algae TaxID=38313 RepID=UPI001AAC6228|nr:hypothetical protein [Shewanella algae]MBO2625942.1 hypothetical protein [Shewanella algae]
MPQFDKTLSISLKPQDPASIAQALQQYRQHLHDGSAFRLEGSLRFNIEFVNEQQQPLSNDDAGGNRNLLVHALSAARAHHTFKYCTEAVLFAAALNFPELLDEIKATAEAMVAFSRSRNDFSDLFLDDYNVFGVEALYMLARQYPELSHYLATFLVPYWDLDSGYTPVELLGKLVEEFGWRRELIHAYLHCDGEQSRRCFFQTAEGDPVNPSLLEHFTEHADDYAWFKAQLLKRLKQTPLLAYADEQTLEETQPILEFFYSLDDWPVEAELEDTELWRDQVKQQLILGLRVEDEALALQDALGVEPKAQVAEAWLMDDRLAPWQQDKTDTGNAQAEQESGKSSGQTQGDSQLPSLEELPFFLLSHTCKQSDFAQLDAAIADRLPAALDKLPTHLGGVAYAAYRLARPECTAAETQALLGWLEQHFLTAYMRVFNRHGGSFNSNNPQHLTLKAWLTEAKEQQDAGAMAAVADSLLDKDGGTRGSQISQHQAAYWLFFPDDGFQRGLLSLFFLLNSQLPEAHTELQILAQRHWQLLLKLAPMVLISRISQFYANYEGYAAIDDPQTEQSLHQKLLALGVSEAQLDAHTLLQDRRIARYAPANERFWQRYLERLASFAEGDPEDNSMIGRSHWQAQQKLLDALGYCDETAMLGFIADLKACFPERPLPQQAFELFNLSLQRGLEQKLKPAAAKAVYDKLQAYLQSGEGLENLTPQALKLPVLQGWDPYSDYRGKVGVADFVWLLPTEMGERLALFLSGLGKRGLHWLGCPSVREAYVNHLVAEGHLNMAERWQDEALGHSSIGDVDVSLQLEADKEFWALLWLDRIGVTPQATVYFAMHEGRQPESFIIHLASQQRLPDMSGLLTADERKRLLEIIAKHNFLTKENTEPFKQDESSVVRRMLNKLF